MSQVFFSPHFLRVCGNALETTIHRVQKFKRGHKLSHALDLQHHHATLTAAIFIDIDGEGRQGPLPPHPSLRTSQTLPRTIENLILIIDIYKSHFLSILR